MLLLIYYVNYLQSSIYLSQDFYMPKGEFDMLYLYAGGGGAMIFSFHKSTSLEGGSEKKASDDQEEFPKCERN